jgi:hypothetical protein
MRESPWWLGLVLIAGCSAADPAQTCRGSAAECLFSSMTIHDFDLDPGPALPLSTVRTDAIRELAVRDAAPEGEQSGVRVTGPGSLSFAGADGAGKELSFSWEDQFGCRPAFCFSPCPKNARCYASSSCTNVLRDGKTNAVTHHWLTFEQPRAPAVAAQL